MGGGLGDPGRAHRSFNKKLHRHPAPSVPERTISIYSHPHSFSIPITHHLPLLLFVLIYNKLFHVKQRWLFVTLCIKHLKVLTNRLHQSEFCQAQPQHQLQLWLRLALYLNSPTNPPHPKYPPTQPIKQARYRAGVSEHVSEDGHVRELYILCFVVK